MFGVNITKKSKKRIEYDVWYGNLFFNAQKRSKTSTKINAAPSIDSARMPYNSKDKKQRYGQQRRI